MDQISRTRFLEEYGGIYIYGIGLNKIYTIVHRDIRFVHKYWYALIGNPDETDGT